MQGAFLARWCAVDNIETQQACCGAGESRQKRIVRLARARGSLVERCQHACAQDERVIARQQVDAPSVDEGGAERGRGVRRRDLLRQFPVERCHALVHRADRAWARALNVAEIVAAPWRHLLHVCARIPRVLPERRPPGCERGQAHRGREERPCYFRHGSKGARAEPRALAMCLQHFRKLLDGRRRRQKLPDKVAEPVVRVALHVERRSLGLCATARQLHHVKRAVQRRERRVDRRRSSARRLVRATDACEPRRGHQQRARGGRCREERALRQQQVGFFRNRSAKPFVRKQCLGCCVLVLVPLLFGLFHFFLLCQKLHLVFLVRGHDAAVEGLRALPDALQLVPARFERGVGRAGLVLLGELLRKVFSEGQHAQVADHDGDKNANHAAHSGAAQHLMRLPLEPRANVGVQSRARRALFVLNQPVE